MKLPPLATAYGVERPDLHGCDALLEQALRERAGVPDEGDLVLVGPLRRGLVRADARCWPLLL